MYIIYTTRAAAAADRDGGNTMTILRPLSVMTPGPGDPEVAYAKQGTSAARNSFAVALIWTGLDDNVYIYILYIAI